MRLSLTGLRSRLSERVDNAARGTDVPAGIERPAVDAPTSSRERGQMRRRLRELRRLREAALLELGALVLEAHRHGRNDTPVIARKAAEAATLDEEARALAEALGTDARLETVVAAGVAGPCPTCGTLASTSARFCSACGSALDGRPALPAHAPDDGAPADVPVADAPAEDPTTAPASEAEPPEGADALTTELPPPNGDGVTPDEQELEATTGGDR